METEYPMSAWIERTLTRRLQYFGNTFTNYDVDIDNVKEVFQKETADPEHPLGCPVMRGG